MSSTNARVGRALFIALALFASAAASAGSWWNTDWAYRTPIAIDTSPAGANVADAVGRTAMLVRLHAGNFNFADVRANGSDLRFVAADHKTLLNYHIESFDPVAEEAALWVDVPNAAPGGRTTIYLYYGGGKEASATADAAATYDENQLLVYHFDGQGAPADATRYANDALTDAPRTSTALIGRGLLLDGVSHVMLPSLRAGFAKGQPLTLSMWIKPAAERAAGVLFDSPGVLRLGLSDGTPYVALAGSADSAKAQQQIGAGVWTHVAVRLGNQLELIVNGEVVASTPFSITAAPTSSAPLTGVIGAAADKDGYGTLRVDTKVSGFNGVVDELGIATSARPTGFFQLAARSQGADSRLLTFEPAEQQAQAGQGYMSILLGAVTVDGWVVIILLAVMAAISWWVMIGKALYLRTAELANQRFLEVYRIENTSVGAMSAATLSADQDELREPEEGKSRERPFIARAPLYRLHTVGRESLAKAIEAQGAAAKELSAQSIALIRSALDGAMVRETRRLNRLMVLLTIAISGGPFLGLLGTVVGVMITFAAIAAAGDVNINSIAPGIAAALVATVAGLAVAIPALFGYNYLTSRIEELSSELHLFVDELEKRIAVEYHGVPLAV